VPSAWSVVDSIDGEVRDDVELLLVSIERETGDEAFSESGFDRRASRTTRHALRYDDASLTGYGIVSGTRQLDGEPALGTFDDGFAHLLERDDAAASLLLRTVDDQVIEALAPRGWSVARRVDRLRRALPADSAPATTLEVRAFVPGRDEEAWVAQNNESFVGHPTQGVMTVERLEAREHAPWFDPAGFLLFFDGTRLAASCWTKVHRGATATVGEIYVVSVAPFAQGAGLGRVAVLRGLEHLAGRGIGLAELYVEEDNVGAYHLYETLGFAYDARVVELRRDVPNT
jgi:mycothiol synthase